MLDAKGNLLEVGNIVLFPKGASYQVGVILKFGNTVSLVGISSNSYYTGFKVSKGRKQALTLIEISEADLFNFLTRVANHKANAEGIISSIQQNPNRFNQDGTLNYQAPNYITNQETIEEYIFRESRRLIQLSRILKGHEDLGNYEPQLGENPEQYLPRRR